MARVKIQHGQIELEADGVPEIEVVTRLLAAVHGVSNPALRLSVVEVTGIAEQPTLAPQIEAAPPWEPAARNEICPVCKAAFATPFALSIHQGRKGHRPKPDAPPEPTAPRVNPRTCDLCGELWKGHPRCHDCNALVGKGHPSERLSPVGGAQVCGKCANRRLGEVRRNGPSVEVQV